MAKRGLFALTYLVASVFIAFAEEKKTIQKRGATTERQDISYGGWSPILPGHRYYFGPRYASSETYQPDRPYILNPSNQVVHVHEDTIHYQQNTEDDKGYSQEPEVGEKTVESVIDLRLPTYNVESPTPYPENSKDKNIFTYYPPPTTASPFSQHEVPKAKPVYTETSNKPFGLDFLDHYQKIGVFQLSADTPYPDPPHAELTPPLPAPYKEKQSLSHPEGAQQFSAVEAIPIRVPAKFLAQANIDQAATLEDNIKIIKVPIGTIQHNRLQQSHDANIAEHSNVSPLFGFPQETKSSQIESQVKFADFQKSLFSSHEEPEARPSAQHEELAVNRFRLLQEVEKMKFGSPFSNVEPTAQHSNLNVAQLHAELSESNRQPKHSDTLKEIEALGYSPPAHVEEYQLPNGLKEIHTYHFPAPGYKPDKELPQPPKQAPQVTEETKTHPHLQEQGNGQHDFRYFHIHSDMPEQPPFKLESEQLGQSKFEPHQARPPQHIIPPFPKGPTNAEKQHGDQRGEYGTPIQIAFDQVLSNFGSGGYPSEPPKGSQQYEFQTQSVQKPPTHGEKTESIQTFTFPVSEGVPGHHQQHGQQPPYGFPVYQSETTDADPQKYEGFPDHDGKNQQFHLDMNYRPGVQSDQREKYQQSQIVPSELSGNYPSPVYQIPGYEGPKEYTIEIIAEDGDKQDQQQPQPQPPVTHESKGPYKHPSEENKETPQNVVPVIVAEITRRPQRPPDKEREYSKQTTSESQKSHGSPNSNEGYSIQEQKYNQQQSPIIEIPSKIIFPSSYHEKHYKPPEGYEAHDNHPGGGYEGPSGPFTFDGKDTRGYSQPVKAEVEQNNRPYESSNLQAEEYRPEFIQGFPTYQQPEQQKYDQSYQSSQSYDRPSEQQSSEPDYQDIQKEPALYHLPVVIQPFYPVTTEDAAKESPKQQEAPKPVYHQPQRNYQHYSQPAVHKQQEKKVKEARPTYRTTQRPSLYTQRPALQTIQYEKFLPHSSGSQGEQLFVSGSKNSHRPSPPKSTEMKVLASHPTKPPLSKHVLSQLGLDRNTKSNLYHAYYAPPNHDPPPGYVRLSLKEFKELFKNAEIHYVSSASQPQSSLNISQSVGKVHYTSPPPAYRHESNHTDDSADEQEEIITIDLKPGQTINEALAEIGTLDIGGVKLDATKLQNGEYGPVEIVEIVEETETPENKTAASISLPTFPPLKRERPKSQRIQQKSPSLRNHRLHSGRSSLSSQASSSKEVVVPVPTTTKKPIIKQIPSVPPPLRSTNAALPKRPSLKAPGRTPATTSRYQATTSRYQVTTRTTPRTTTTTTTTTTPSTTSEDATTPRFGHRIRPVRVKG